MFRMTSEASYVFLKNTDNTLDVIDNCCSRASRLHFDGPYDYDLGALDVLPLEIVHMTLIQLDIQSLIDFRRVNKRARLITDSMPQFKQILTHVPASIRGSLNIETARFFSCQDLYEKLSTAECESCGDFGGYLYLVTCRRVCYLCFTEKPDYLPLLRKDVTRKFGLRLEHLAALPRMKSFPGCYSPRELKRSTRTILFDHSAARQAGIALHGTVSAMEKYASDMAAKKMEVYLTKTSLHTTPGRARRPPRTEDEFDGYSSNPKRFMAIICAPYLDARLGTPDWGSHCLACKRHHYSRPLHWRRKFTTDGFQKHISECGDIVDGQHIPRTR